MVARKSRPKIEKQITMVLLESLGYIVLLPKEFASIAARNYPLHLYPVPFDLQRQKNYITWKKGRNDDPGHRWLREQIANEYSKDLASTAG